MIIFLFFMLKKSFYTVFNCFIFCFQSNKVSYTCNCGIICFFFIFFDLRFLTSSYGPTLPIFLGISRFSIYPPGPPNRIKFSRIFQKKRKINSHNKKIIPITKYYSIVCSFLYLLNSLTNRQNNKRDVRLLSTSATKIFFTVHL